MHFFRNEMLHDMRVSKKAQSKLVSCLELNKVVHWSDIASSQFCQVMLGQIRLKQNAELSKSARVVDNHRRRPNWKTWIFSILFPKHLDLNKIISFFNWKTCFGSIRHSTFYIGCLQYLEVAKPWEKVKTWSSLLITVTASEIWATHFDSGTCWSSNCCLSLIIWEIWFWDNLDQSLIFP